MKIDRNDCARRVDMSHCKLGFKMSSKRAHVVIPEDLLTEIDSLVGQRGRSAFLVEALRPEVQRRKLLAALHEAKGCWKSEDHPELKNGASAWVDQLRAENEDRISVSEKS